MARTSRGRKYTDEQRAERARLDGELLDRAARTLAGDAQVIGDFVRQAVTGMSPRILGYSLRNQMLLMEQADDRGIRLTDVDTFKGWLSRGRCVRRGEQGLRIIRPVGSTDEDAQAKDEPSTGAEHHHPENEEARAERVLFRMMVVFELSQTDGVEGDDPQAHDCPACGAEPGEPCGPGCICPGCTSEDAEIVDAAELLWNNLYEQITRAGYRFDWPAEVPGGRVRVDHDARAVHVAMSATADDPDALADLTVAVAQILTRVDQDRAAKRAARVALPSRESMC
jgi:N-terminal domain of anti-restriction factor ArdC